MKDEIEVLLVRSTYFKKQFEETDTKVGTFLEEQTSDLTVRKYLQTLWKNDCQNEESTTHKIWENKESPHRSTYKKEKEEETIHTLVINQESSVSPGNSNNITGKTREEQPSLDQFYPNQNIQPNFNQFNPNQNVNLYLPQQFHYGNGFNRRGNNMSGNYNQGQRRGYKPKFKRPRKPPGFGNQPPQQGFWSQPQQGFWNRPQQGYWNQPQQGFWNQPQQGPWSQPSGPPRSQQNTGQPYRNDVSQGGSEQNEEQRQVQTPTPQVNEPTNQNTSQHPTNPIYAEVSTAQQGGETAQTQTENQTQKN